MAKHQVTFKPAGVTVEADPAMYPYGPHGQPGSLLDIALAHGVEIEHACGGVGACGTCHVIVEEGMESLCEADEDELDTVELAPANTSNSRLACQAIVGGDVTVFLPEWNRNVPEKT